MKNLIVDFSNYNGHQMVLTSKEGFQRKGMHELELNMLNENMISSLLPFSWMEMDGEVSFYYGIEGYRLLAHYLRTQQFTMHSYYTLLLSIADGLATCFEYMLRPECCLIDEHMLYFHVQQERIKLAYVPLQQPLEGQQSQQLLLLAVRWSSLVNDLDVHGYHRILQLLSSEKLPIIPLRQLLLDLIHEQSKGLVKQISHSQTNDSGIHRLKDRSKDRANQHSQVNIEGSNGENQGSQMTSDNESEHEGWEGLEGEDLYEDKDHELNGLTWKHYAIITIVIVSIAMLWIRQYSANPTSEQLLLCLGISSGLLALLGYVLIKPILAMISNRRQEIQLDLESEPLIEDSASSSSGIANLMYGIHAEGNAGMLNSTNNVQSHAVESPTSIAINSIVDISAERASKLESTAQVMSNKDWYEEQDGSHIGQSSRASRASIQHEENPALKSSSKKRITQLATVMLSDEQQATSQLQVAEPVLVRNMNGAKDRIILDEETFLIGRAEEGVHFRESAKGVSRIHIELERSNGKLQVKDTGSRNGTFLNDQLMIAYKSYKLERGDKLQLASREGPVYEVTNA